MFTLNLFELNAMIKHCPGFSIKSDKNQTILEILFNRVIEVISIRNLLW